MFLRQSVFPLDSWLKSLLSYDLRVDLYALDWNICINVLLVYGRDFDRNRLRGASRLRREEMVSHIFKVTLSMWLSGRRGKLLVL
jgi:hypothetical protein